MTRAALAAFAAALVAIALLAIHPPSEPGPFLRDFEAYYSAGSAINAHRDPYSRELFRYEAQVPGVDATRPELLPFVGAPPTAVLWSALARINYLTAARIWLCAMGLALAVTLLATLRCCGVRLTLLDGFIAAICALSFVPITSGFVLGQPAIIAYAAAALAVVYVGRSTVQTTLALLVGAMQPNIALAALAIAGTRRGVVALALAACGLYGLGAAYGGLRWPLAYAELLRAHGAAERVIAIQYTPNAVLFGFGWTQAQANAAGIAVAVAAFAFAIVGMLRTRDVVRRFAIACAALPFVSGFVHEHNFVLLFIPALWAVRSFSLRVQGFVVLAFGLAAVNWLDFAQQPGAVAQDIVLGIGAIAAILAWAPRRSIASYAGAVAATVTVFCGAWIGTHHPAPIWPNDMRASHAAASASAASIWHLEAIHTGLERAEPAWALLRSFSLAGSAILLAVLVLAKPRLDIDVHEVVERGNRVRIEVL